MAAEEPSTFWSHLEALRRTLMRVAAVLVVAVAGCFVAMPWLFDHVILAPTTSRFPLYRWLARLGAGRGDWLPNFGGDFSVDIINYNVASQFMTHISASCWLALLVIFPYLIYEVWNFVRPALFPNERRNVGVAFVCGTVLFFAGCIVGYGLVFPFTFRFLTEYQLSPTIENHISLDSYMGNFLMMIFVMGLVFELPLLTWLLSRLGVVSRSLLCRYRRHAIVALLVLSAVITPSGDPFTLMVVFLPIYLLYELGVRFARD